MQINICSNDQKTENVVLVSVFGIMFIVWLLLFFTFFYYLISSIYLSIYLLSIGHFPMFLFFVVFTEP